MAKVSATTTLSPHRFIPGARVNAADGIDVLEQVNWSFGNRRSLHVAFVCGKADWSSNSVYTHGVSFPAPGAWRTVFLGRARINADVNGLRWGAQCKIDNADGVTVRLTVGALSEDLTFRSSDNGTYSPGTFSGFTESGWVTVRLELNTDAGGTGGNQVVMWHLQEKEIAAASMPDPPDS